MARGAPKGRATKEGGVCRARSCHRRQLSWEHEPRQEQANHSTEAEQKERTRKEAWGHRSTGSKPQQKTNHRGSNGRNLRGPERPLDQRDKTSTDLGRKGVGGGRGGRGQSAKVCLSGRSSCGGRHEAGLTTGHVCRSRGTSEHVYCQGKVLSRATTEAGAEGPGDQSAGESGMGLEECQGHLARQAEPWRTTEPPVPAGRRPAAQTRGRGSSLGEGRQEAPVKEYLAFPTS